MAKHPHKSRYESKFSFNDAVSNADGKTSGSGICGLFCVTVGLVGFIVGVVFYVYQKDSQIMTQSIMLVGSGSAILAYRKAHDGPLAQSIVDNNCNSDEDPIVAPPGPYPIVAPVVANPVEPVVNPTPTPDPHPRSDA